jgi:hypothetical protein
MARPRGFTKTGGRKKGTPNRFTSSVKAVLLAAFDDLGGVTALAEWAREHPTEFYRLWAKMLPRERIASPNLDDALGDDLGRSLQSLLAAAA